MSSIAAGQGWSARARAGAEVGWLRREVDVDEAPDVARTWRHALVAVLGPLDDIESGLGRDTLSYVLEGEPIPAVQRLNKAALSPYFGLSCVNRRTQPVQRGVYEVFDQVPPPVAVRWATLLELVYGSQSWGLRMPEVAGGHWAEVLLIHVHNVFDNGRAPWPGAPIDLATIERMLLAEGAGPHELLAAAMRNSTYTRYGSGPAREVLPRLGDFGEAVARHAPVLAPTLPGASVDDRVLALDLIARADDRHLAGYAGALAELATCTSARVRSAATPLVVRVGCAAVPSLRGIAEQGKPEQRVQALRLLMEAAGDDAEVRSFARATAGADRAASVRNLLAEWDRATELEVAQPDPVVPEAGPVEWAVRWTPEVQRTVERLVGETRERIAAENKSRQALAQQLRAQGVPVAAWITATRANVPADALDGIRKELTSARAPAVQDRLGTSLLDGVIKGADPELSAVAVVKLLAMSGELVDNHQPKLHVRANMALNAVHRASGGPTLLELERMLDEIGIDGQSHVHEAYFAEWGEPLGHRWRDEAVWPFFAKHLDATLQSRGEPAFYRALSTFPTLPGRALDGLFASALGTRKAERELAQGVLERLPGREERIAAALRDGKGEVRAAAAQWLGRIKHPGTIPALEAAVAAEKQDVAKAAMLDALEAMGEPVEKYLDRDALAREAVKALAKPLPKTLDWMAWSMLPVVHWADSGEAVPTDTLKWLVVQAVKAKSAEPNAILLKYCSMFDPDERERLGQFLLEAWIAEDLRPISPDEAARLAGERAAQMHTWMSRMPQHFEGDPLFGASVEQLTAAYLPGFARRPVGSAIAGKGVLAVAAACAGRRAADTAARYLNEWYGMRAGQGKALIGMLAWVDDPGATQLMLSIGSRFRTKGFQEEATRQAKALAERKGWTMTELADRTIPTSGFDETGTLELSYGERVFTAHLQPDLTVVLRSPEGKVIKALPNPRQSDDDAAVKASKRALGSARKELKAIATLQRDRLYEALCTERSWPADDWRRYLAEHPLMRHLVQRLVWLSTDGDTVTTFRPLDDGTLTDVDDNEVRLSQGEIRLAHDTNLSPELVQQWQRHLADYEVAPLFQQLGKGVYDLPEDRQGIRRIDDFRGHLIESFALRGRATKLGYTRGPAEDGGWFTSYLKRFPSLGITTVVGFTGNPLPEQQRTVALTELSFVRSAEGGASAELGIGDVPTVLLSEAWNDLRLIAAAGSGYDADWQRKSELTW